MAFLRKIAIDSGGVCTVVISVCRASRTTEDELDVRSVFQAHCARSSPVSAVKRTVYLVPAALRWYRCTRTRYIVDVAVCVVN